MFQRSRIILCALFIGVCSMQANDIVNEKIEISQEYASPEKEVDARL